MKKRYFHPLQEWLEDNMPELDLELTTISDLNLCRVRLNEITGHAFTELDPIGVSMDGYLERLKEIKA